MPISPNSNQHGFTLIELMIVVAILGILLSIAIPAYSDYTIRARLGEGISMSSFVKNSVTEYRQSQGSWPADNAAAGVPAPADLSTKWVDSIEVSSTGALGVITITFANIPALGAAANTTLSVSGSSTISNAVDWDCNVAVVGTLPTKFTPSTCR